MPAPINISIKNVVYSTPILNGEMDSIAREIQARREEINSLNRHLTDAISSLNNLQQQFMALYIQQTGSFPNGNGVNFNGGGGASEESDR